MMVGVKQRYRYRLYPHPHQQMALAKAFGCARVVWNDALAMSRELYAAGEKSSYPVLAKLCITQAKQTPERSWLSGPSNVVLQQSVRDLDQAFRNWWASLKGKRKGPKVRAPRFKKRRGAQSIRFMSHVFRTGDRTLTLSKIGTVPIEWSRALPSAPSSCTVIRDASGRYFASFVVEVEPTPLPANGKAIGIDLGLASLAVTSAGEKIAPPKFLRSALCAEAAAAAAAAPQA
jgi:putative transposase